MKFVKVLKAKEDELFQIGWDMEIAWENDEEEVFPSHLIPDDKIIKIVDKIEDWFLKEGYKQFFTSITDEGHDSWGLLGGSALVTQEQLDSCSDEGWRTTAGTLHLPSELEAPYGYLWVSVFVYDFENPKKI